MNHFLRHSGPPWADSLSFFCYGICSRPTFIRIEFGYGLSNGCSVRSQVFLVDDSVMVDDERHDPGRSILGWICDHAEAAHHLSAYDIIVGSTWRVGSLPGEDLVIVAVVRDRLTISALIPRGLGLNDKRSKRAWLFIGFGLPVQAITLPLVLMNFCAYWSSGSFCGLRC